MGCRYVRKLDSNLSDRRKEVECVSGGTFSSKRSRRLDFLMIDSDFAIAAIVSGFPGGYVASMCSRNV